MSISPLPFNQVKETRHGKMLYNINDVYIGRSIELYGEYSHLEVEVFAKLIHPGDVVIDVGANIGVHTLFMARAVGEQGGVIAFEPQRIVFQTLCANMALNSITNVICYQQGVSDQIGRLQTVPLNYSSPNNFGGMSLGNFPGGEIVGVIPLDQVSVPRCGFIKVDVEGMELQVLKGAVGLIEKNKPVLYVENDRPDKSDALLAYLKAIGYRIYLHRPALFNPNNFFRNAQNVFGEICSQNLLCFHRSRPQAVAGMPVGEICQSV